MPARRNPQDVTGVQSDVLTSKAAAQRKAREAELAMITPIDVDSDEVVDLTIVPEVEVSDEPVEVERDVRPVEIRTNTSLESVTIGAGNNYTFHEGQMYRVPAHVAAHLEEKGYVYH